MINGEMQFSCDGMTAPELAEHVRDVGEVTCDEHGTTPLYHPATGATFDQKTGKYRGKCRVKVECCCEKLLRKAQLAHW